jgi:hypothetical protein
MTTRSQLGGSDGICTCEEGNLVAAPDQFFGQVRNDALSAAVQPWGNAFDKRCYLCDLHDDFSMFLQKQTRASHSGSTRRALAQGLRRELLSAGIVSRRWTAVSVAKLQFLKSRELSWRNSFSVARPTSETLTSIDDTGSLPKGALQQSV